VGLLQCEEVCSQVSVPSETLAIVDSVDPADVSTGISHHWQNIIPILRILAAGSGVLNFEFVVCA